MRADQFRRMKDTVEFGTEDEIKDMEHMGYLFLDLTDLQVMKLIDTYFDRGLARFDVNKNYKSVVCFGAVVTYMYDGDEYTKYQLKRLEREHARCGK